ncbi:protein suppressor of white apricot [Eurosta solidaginis]|uniref:protein suppressor of white apricot n=1 Tax=Eurosta solidaginis TaxID=178769 RepID=UPI0035309802
MSYYNIPRPPVREYAGSSVGGILRKSASSSSTSSTITPHSGVYSNYTTTTSSTTALNAGEARQVDLLVFGYACKLFRDDDKARDIDQGKHMIPWMGDANLKIDRYDVRGALPELAPHEPPPGGYGNRLDYLSAEEQRAEQLCEEERYLYLYNNEEDHILQQEEDLKRLKQDVEGGNYAQVDFQYGSDGSAGVLQHGPSRDDLNQSPSGEDTEQAFSLPKGFEVPISIQLPETMKQHAIIEKTARFIASQGMQMEILLKAKQSNNIQFEFLAINGVLNPYYKYILNAIKNDTYPAQSAMLSPQSHNEPSIDLAVGASSSVKPIITVPTIKYKPSANCAYTQLISKIKGVPLPAVIDGELANMPTSDSPTPTTAVAAAANFTPVLLQYNKNTYVSADAEEGANSNSNSQVNGNVRTEVELLSKSSALTLAQDYASDTESEVEDNNEEPVRMKTPPPPKFEPILSFPVPTETLKNIIDKTASYVIKNGRQFEETLRSKSVDRFTFLLYDNEHYPYYLYKVTGDPDAASKEQKQRKAAAVAAALMSKKKLLAAEKSISPVCFSIKSKEDSAATMLQPGLPREPSDDDDESTAKAAPSNSTQTRMVPEHVQKAIQMVESQLMARNAQLAATINSRNSSNALLPAPALLGMGASSNQQTTSRFDNYNSSSAGSLTKLHLKNTKAELERNALFEQQQQNRQKELRKAEEKVKDKLAKIAREKLGAAPVAKEKQLQLERKRKAMAFLTQIKGSPSANNSGKNSPNDPDKSIANASDTEASVHSIPITSYGPEDDGNADEQEKQRLIEIPTTHIAGETPIVKLSNPTNMPDKGETKSKPTPTVNVSDDDDVQLISDINPISRASIPKQRKDRKRQLRSRTRDSSEDAKPKSSIKHAHKRKQRRRSRSNSESSEDEDDSCSSSESSSSSSSSSSASTTTSSSSTSDDSTDYEADERLRSRSRSHRKHKSSTKSAKKSKRPKTSKLRKLEVIAIRSEPKQKPTKRTHEEEYKIFKAERKAHKERERKRERARKHKERAMQIAYEREQLERSKKHSRQHNTSAEDAYQQQKRLQRAQHKAEIQLLAAAAKREQERERQREREHRERRKQRDRELERERDRSHSPTDYYAKSAARKEKKKKRER